MRTRKSKYHLLIDRVVIIFMLTLLVFSAITEQVILTLNVIKTNFHNKMDDEFFMKALMLFIEKDIIATVSTDSIIDDFEDLKKC